MSGCFYMLYKNYLKSKYKYNYMLLALLLITLCNTLHAASTKFDYTNINQNIYQPINQTINQNITNKTIIIYENYSMLDVFSHYDPKPISKQDLITFVSFDTIFNVIFDTIFNISFYTYSIFIYRFFHLLSII